MAEEELITTIALKLACEKLGAHEKRTPEECMTDLIKQARLIAGAARISRDAAIKGPVKPE